MPESRTLVVVARIIERSAAEAERVAKQIAVKAIATINRVIRFMLEIRDSLVLGRYEQRRRRSLEQAPDAGIESPESANPDPIGNAHNRRIPLERVFEGQLPTALGNGLELSLGRIGRSRSRERILFLNPPSAARRRSV